MKRATAFSLTLLVLFVAVMISSPVVFADDAPSSSRAGYVDANGDGVCDLFDADATQFRRNRSGNGDCPYGNNGIRDRKRDGSGDGECPNGNDGIRDRKRDGSGNGEGKGNGKGRGRRGR